MPVAPTYPGVYIEEVPSGVRTITGVGTSIAAFVGRALRGPVDEAVVINSFADYERVFGGLWLDSAMSYAVRDFYMNGGGQAVIVRLFAPTSEEQEDAFDDAEAEAQAAADAVIEAIETALLPANVTPATTDADIAAAARGSVSGAAGSPAFVASNAVALAAEGEVNDPASTDPADHTAVHTTASAALAAAVASAASSAAPIARARLSVGGTGTKLDIEAAYEGAWGNDLRARIDNDVKGGATNLFNLSVKDTKTGQLEVFRNVSLDTGHARRVDKVLASESQLVRTRGAIPAVTVTVTRPAANAPAATGSIPAGVVATGSDAFDTTHSSGVGASERSSDGRTLVADDYTPAGAQANKVGLYALLKADLFNMLCLPPFELDGDIDPTIITAAAVLCESRRAMLIVDPPSTWNTVASAIAGVGAVGTSTKNAALYFPRLLQPNPLRDNQLEEFVPCGTVAGVWARTDSSRGVWKAPAGLEATLVGVPQLEVQLTDLENGQLNPLGINCLRAMPAAGRVVWGARTLQGDDRLASEWKYVPVRRLALFVEESLYRGTQWVVFEPNDEPLWAQIRLNVGAFMHNLFRQGAFQGKSPREAYLVKCDAETTTQNDRNLGIVNVIVGFAPLKPAEFVIIKIQQLAGQIDA